MNQIEILYKDGSMGDNFKSDTTLFFEGYDKNYNLTKLKARLEQGNYGYNVERIKKELMNEETFKLNCLGKWTFRQVREGYIVFKYFTPTSFSEMFRKIILKFAVYKEESDMYDEYKDDIYDEFYQKINWKKLLTKK